MREALPEERFVTWRMRWVGVCLAVLVSACASARLEPAPGAARVPHKPRAGAVEREGVQLIAEADAWNAPDNVRDEVTTLKVTVVNRGAQAVAVDYTRFSLVSPDGDVFLPVAPADITIRGGSRSIGLPADAIVTRADSSTGLGPNSLYRSAAEKEEIRQQLIEQSLDSGELAPGERMTGYVYFQRVPASKEQITLRSVLRTSAGKTVTTDIPFQVRKNP
jgi:hypothetical protein